MPSRYPALAGTPEDYYVSPHNNKDETKLQRNVYAVDCVSQLQQLTVHTLVHEDTHVLLEEGQSIGHAHSGLLH